MRAHACGRRGEELDMRRGRVGVRHGREEGGGDVGGKKRKN